MTINYRHLTVKPHESIPQRDTDRGHLTIAYYIDDEYPERGKILVVYAVSACSPEDQFEKAKGRLKATSRLGSIDRSFMIQVDENTNNSEIVNQILDNIDLVGCGYQYGQDPDILTPLWLFGSEEYQHSEQFMQ